jgi:Ankyrin repeats (3 copies)
MFPNPQDALPLPSAPNLQQYKKLAKDLVNVCKSGNPDAVQLWATDWIDKIVRLTGLEIASRQPVDVQRWIEGVTDFATKKLHSGERRCVLADAQFVIARSHGFTSWPGMAEHIEQLTKLRSSVAQFELAADAVVAGDIRTLKRLLRENPGLVRERSKREHRATLLHYTSANGIEGYRQKTPKNIVEIADLLLKSDAEVDATADVYGSGCTTLGLAATSIHPELAGVQEALLQILLDHGAVIDKPESSGNARSAVIACLANGRQPAAEFLAGHGAKLDLESAAGIGRLDIVETFFNSAGALKPLATKKDLQNGFLWACMYGCENVIAFLLDRGADLLDPLDSGATALHWAAGGAHANVVKLLLDRGAPLEELNMWGGTVLEHAGWGFEHAVPGIDFGPVFEALLASGATIRGHWLAWLEKVKRRSTDERSRVAEIFRQYGATS